MNYNKIIKTPLPLLLIAAKSVNDGKRRWTMPAAVAEMVKLGKKTGRAEVKRNGVILPNSVTSAILELI